MCERSGFDAARISERVKLFELDGESNRRLGLFMHQQVIVPRTSEIVDHFMRSLRRLDEFTVVTANDAGLQRLTGLLQRYLLGLGTHVESFEYFEQRLLIGHIHHRMGIPQPVYQTSFRALQCELIRNIPSAVREDRAGYDALVDYMLKVIALDVSLAVESYCKSRTCGLEHTIETQRGATERFRHMAVTDYLTELHNHAYSRHLLAEKLGESRSSRKPLCVIMADLDQFKQINDTHGHLVGDHVLRIAAARMVAAARSGDEIGRYGGEEFLFLLTNTDLAAAAVVAERIRKRVGNDAIRHDDATIRTTVSLGIAEARDADTVDDLIARADAALYAAKLAGRNRIMLEKAPDKGLDAAYR
jgi:diguanylate cyclase (GGDEF)-like protein